MDANKLDKLNEIGYKIRPTCDLCKHASLSSDGWGVCMINSYVHKKHGDVRELSVHRSGYCPGFEADEAKLVLLHGFATLIEDV